MIQDGVFGADKPRVQGKPRWKLVDEKLGKEVDISSSFCIPIKSRAVKKTLDADKEEWDVIDDGTSPYIPRMPSVELSNIVSYDSDCKQQTSLQPKTEQPRKVKGGIPRLLCTSPGTGRTIYVRVTGSRLFDASFSYTVKRKRGRPKGSKNKKKRVEAGGIDANIDLRSSLDSAIGRAPSVGAGLVNRAISSQRTAVYSVEGPVCGSTAKGFFADRLSSPSRKSKTPELCRQRYARLDGGRQKGNGEVSQSLRAPAGRTSSAGTPSSGKKSKARPRRAAAPLYLAESPSFSEACTFRPRRSAAPSYLGESPASPRHRPLKNLLKPRSIAPLPSPCRSKPSHQAKISRWVTGSEKRASDLYAAEISGKKRSAYSPLVDGTPRKRRRPLRSSPRVVNSAA